MSRPSLPYLGTQFKLNELIIPLGTTAFQQVLPVNANRFAIVFCSVTGGQINLSRNPNAPLSGSLTLANAANASVQDLVLTFADVGSLVQDSWFAVGNIPAQTLGIQEVMYVPTGEPQP